MYRSTTGKFERWFNPNWMDINHIPSTPADLRLIKQTFIDAVVKRLMSDAPLAILLSGGLDSSLVASVAVRCGEGAGEAVEVCSGGRGRQGQSLQCGGGGAREWCVKGVSGGEHMAPAKRDQG